MMRRYAACVLCVILNGCTDRPNPVSTLGTQADLEQALPGTALYREEPDQLEIYVFYRGLGRDETRLWATYGHSPNAWAWGSWYIRSNGHVATWKAEGRLVRLSDSRVRYLGREWTWRPVRRVQGLIDLHFNNTPAD